MRPRPEDLLMYVLGFVLWSALLYYTLVDPFTYLRN
jgi:hypothetical protein